MTPLVAGLGCALAFSGQVERPEPWSVAALPYGSRIKDRLDADVLVDHVTIELECIDRICLTSTSRRSDVLTSGRAPMSRRLRLMWPSGVVGFLKHHRHMPFALGVRDPISKDFVASIHRFVKSESVNLVRLAAGQRKDVRRHRLGVSGCSWWHREGVFRQPRPGEDQDAPNREAPQPPDRVDSPRIVTANSIV